MRTHFLIVAALAALAPAACGSGETSSGEPAAKVEQAAALEAGDRAPAFSLPGSDGQTHALADRIGKRGVVIAWFPAAFTPG